MKRGFLFILSLAIGSAISLLIFFLVRLSIVLFLKLKKQVINLFGDDSFFGRFPYIPKPSFIARKNKKNKKKKEKEIEESFDEDFKKRILMGEGSKEMFGKIKKENFDSVKKYLENHTQKTKKTSKIKRKKTRSITHKKPGSYKVHKVHYKTEIFNKGTNKPSKSRGISGRQKPLNLAQLKKPEREKVKIKKSKKKEVFFNKRFNSLEEVIKIISNKNLQDSLIFLKEQDLSFIREEVLENKIFESEEELIEFIKEEISNSLDNIYHDLKDDISELRKKGEDMLYLDLKLMQFPLKLKLFLSTYKRKDLQRAIRILDEVKSEIDLNKKRQEKTKNSKNKESI